MARLLTKHKLELVICVLKYVTVNSRMPIFDITIVSAHALLCMYIRYFVSYCCTLAVNIVVITDNIIIISLKYYIIITLMMKIR